MILQHLGSPLTEVPSDVEHSPTTPSEVTQADFAPPKVVHSPVTPREITHSDPAESGVDMLDIVRKIESITSKLKTKDMEIELLNTEVKTAYITIDLLQQQVTDLEQRCCGSDNHQPLAANSTLSNSCLLLEDTNLRPILLSDLHNNCRLRTIHDANMDMIKSWVTQKLDRIPSQCILYKCIHDILEGSAPTPILDNLGCLISALKDKNNSMNIYACQIVPSSTCQDVNVKIED